MTTAEPQPAFTKTNVTTLWRYEPSGTYYLFARIGGKLKKKSLGTNVFSIAKRRLADRLKAEHQGLELRGKTSTGKLTVRQAGEQLLARLVGNGGKARTPQFYRERMSALFKHAPGIADKDCARLTVADCQAWSNCYRPLVGPATFNGTLLVFRRVVGLAAELNSEVRDLYGGLAEMRKMVKGIRYHGALHNGGRRGTPARPRDRRLLVPAPTSCLTPRPTGDEQSFAE